jgi:hypothetical protein
MSLINEALKRTRDATYQSASPSSAAPPRYQMQGDVEPRGSKGTLFVTVLIAVIAVAVIAMLAVRVSPSLKALKAGLAPDATMAVAETPQPATTATVETPAAEQTPPSPAAMQTPAAPAVNPKIAEDELVARLMEKMKAEQAATPPKPALVEPPKLALQGITYSGESSEAMINGVSLRAGEDIEGARIVTIERRAVRLDFNGREVVLRMP